MRLLAHVRTDLIGLSGDVLTQVTIIAALHESGRPHVHKETCTTRLALFEVVGLHELGAVCATKSEWRDVRSVQLIHPRYTYSVDQFGTSLDLIVSLTVSHVRPTDP